MSDVKVHPECLPCQVNARLSDLARFIRNDRQKLIKALHRVIRAMDRVLEEAYDVSPPVLATAAFRCVKSELGSSDPYRDIKREASAKTLALYHSIKKTLASLPEKRRLLVALKASAVGNSLDVGLVGYEPLGVDQLRKEMASLSLAEDEVENVLSALRRCREVVVVLDNAGEAALDRLIGDELRRMGKYVLAVVKGGAFQNDVTLDEVSELGLRESFDDVLDTGTDAASVFLDEVRKEVANALMSSDLVIAKGMANFEYLTEVESEVAEVLYILRAKCGPVASYCATEVGSYVLLLSSQRLSTP